MQGKQKKEKTREKDGQALLTFLQKTKNGKYAKIDEKSLDYARVNETTEEIYGEEDYYYSLR